MIFIVMKKIPPYFWLYTILKRNAFRNNRPIILTFEEFLEFVKITQCHYCEKIISWPTKAFTRISNRQYKRNSTAYYLDRKNSDIGYTKENCVVCCSTCNAIKGNTLNYEDMMILKPSLIELAKYHNSSPMTNRSQKVE